jgi:hypothetical protein
VRVIKTPDRPKKTKVASGAHIRIVHARSLSPTRKLALCGAAFFSWVAVVVACAGVGVHPGMTRAAVSALDGETQSCFAPSQPCTSLEQLTGQSPVASPAIGDAWPSRSAGLGSSRGPVTLAGAEPLRPADPSHPTLGPVRATAGPQAATPTDDLRTPAAQGPSIVSRSLARLAVGVLASSGKPVLPTSSSIATASSTASSSPKVIASPSRTTTPSASGSPSGTASPVVPVVPVSAGGRLSWAPPALSSPTVISLTDGTGTLKLAAGQDYLVRLPTDRPVVMPQGLTISGGHNVVVIGGTIDVAGGYTASNGGTTRRGMYLVGQSGTVFVEGVRFESSKSGTLTEGIDLDQRLGAEVILQNIHLDRLVGTYSTNHADGVQTWAGPRELLIDGLWIDTEYQGMFLLPNQHFTGPMPQLFDFRNVSISGGSSAGYMIWKDNQVFPWHLFNVFVSPGSHAIDDRSHYLWDPTNSLSAVIGTASPPAVAGSAGIGYVSPGYQ